MDRTATDTTAGGRTRASRLQPWQTRLLRELGIAAFGGISYGAVNALIARLYPADTQVRMGVENGRGVVDLERALHVFREADLFALINGNAFLKLLDNAIYMGLHLPLIIALAIWLYLRRPALYALMRNAFLISGAIALCCEFFPVAPPFLLPELHLANAAAGRVYDVVEPKTLFDVYGAVPSIHVAWSLLLGFAFMRGTVSPWTRAFGAVLPLLMTVGVVATGNHYFFDAFTGALSAVAGLWIGARLPRRQAPAESARS